MKPVLYVDDDENDAFFMCHAWELAQITHPLIHLKDGQAAMDYLDGQGRYSDRKQHPFPCLLLLDLKMPRKSGFDVLYWLRERPALAALRVVVISGSDQSEDVARARDLGAIDYIVKTPVLKVLLEVLRNRKAVWFAPAAR
jgi:CheY-like chemotaxis protein